MLYFINLYSVNMQKEIYDIKNIVISILHPPYLMS